MALELWILDDKEICQPLATENSDRQTKKRYHLRWLIRSDMLKLPTRIKFTQQQQQQASPTSADIDARAFVWVSWVGNVLSGLNVLDRQSCTGDHLIPYHDSA